MRKLTLLIGICMLLLLGVGAVLAVSGGWPASQADADIAGADYLNGQGSRLAGQAEETPQPDNQAMIPSILSGQEGTQWAELPPCAIHPLSAEDWGRYLTDPAAGEAERSALLRRAEALRPAGAAGQRQTQPGLAAALGAGDGQRAAGNQTTEEQRVYAALLMNIAGGQLNRATEINLPDYPGVKTVGDLVDQLEGQAAGQPAAPNAQRSGGSSLAQAGQQILEGQLITRAVCARLLVSQAGNVMSDVQWSSAGIQAADFETGPVSEARKVAGDGTVSPDGKWAAFRSGSQDSGGPVFLLNLAEGEWTNLIEAARTHNPDLPALPDLNSPWDVIGWFPDSRRLAVGPADARTIWVVDIDSYSTQTLVLDGYGMGGSEVVHLAPDGSRLVYIGVDTTGVQSLALLDLNTLKASELVKLSFAEGVLMYPQFSPDGASIDYVLQTGDPGAGLTHAIRLLEVQDGSGQATERVIIEDITGLPPRPSWSPDGQRLAFLRQDSAPAALADGSQAPGQSQLWVVETRDGNAWQVAEGAGAVHSPAWANDSQTLAFVTDQGAVGLVDTGQSGAAWQAVPGSTVLPLFTSAIFVP